MLKVGDKAPDFTLKDQDENSVSLSDYKNKKVVLWFYPKASTPGWTIEGKGFRDEFQEFEEKNYIEARAIIGTRREFFQTLNMLTTMFILKSFDRMLEFIIIQRTNGKKVDNMRDYIVM